ncbi:hypothetical protein PROFUN_14204, partial [Planoprotostelium fungivorum]
FLDEKTKFNSKLEELPKVTGSESIDLRPPSLTFSDNRSAVLRAASEAIENAGDVVRSMRREALSANDKSLTNKCTEYEREVNHMRENLKIAERQSLFQGAKSDMVVTNIDQRNALEQQTQRAKNSTAMLDDVLATAHDTEEIGRGVAGSLNEQSQRMRGMRDDVKGIREDVGLARRTLTSMKRRIMTNKLIFGLIAFLLLALIIFVIWYRWGPSSSDTSSNEGAVTDNSSTVKRWVVERF